MTVTCLAFSGVIAEDGLDTQELSVGATWECVQAHTTQKGWEPDRVPSLWRKV